MFIDNSVFDDDGPGACRFVHTAASSRIPRVHTADGAEHALTRDHRLVADRAGLSEREALDMQRVAAAVRLHQRSAAEENKAVRRSRSSHVVAIKQEGRRDYGALLVDAIAASVERGGDAGLVASLNLKSGVATEFSGGNGAPCEAAVVGIFDGLRIPSAAELARLSNHLPTRSALDTVVLQGGLPCGMLCEIAGESGSGKSTLCMYLAAVCCAAHGRPVTLLATSAAPPALGTLRCLCERVLASNAALTDNALRDALARVTVVRDVRDWQSWEASARRIEQHLKATACGLLIVDSLTAIAESNPSTTAGGAAGRRSDSVLALTGWLKSVADACRLPVVLTNLAAAGSSATMASSIAAAGDESATTAGFASVLDDRANLGVALHHAVNIRTFIERLPPPFSALFHVTKTPVAAAASFAMRYTSASDDAAVAPRDSTAAAAEHSAVDVQGAGIVRFDVLDAAEVRSARASLGAAAGHVLNSGVAMPLVDHTIYAAALMRPNHNKHT